MDARDLKKFSFIGLQSPGTQAVIILVAVVGALLGIGSQFVLETQLLVNLWLFAGLFIFSNLFAAFIIDNLVENFKKKWAYFIVFISQILMVAVVILFKLSSGITLLESLVLWTGISYTLNMLALTGLGSLKIGAKSILLALLQPILIVFLMSFSVDLGVAKSTTPFFIMAGGLLVSTLIILFNEHMFSVLFSGMSAMTELGNFLQGVRGEQATLAMGHKIDVLVQYLMFKAKKEHAIIAPWLHSGPFLGVGGGNLSTRCVEELNEKFGDSFYFHVPCDHESNPSGDVSQLAVDTVHGYDYKELSVSSLAKASKEGMTVYGQRLNDTYLFTLDGGDVDDYSISIIDSLRKRYHDKKIIFADSHPNPPMDTCENVKPFTKEAILVEELTDALLKKLSKATLQKAEIGTAITRVENYYVFALVIKTPKESTLYYISDTNGTYSDERDEIAEVARRMGIKNTLVFSTDTHSLSVKDLINRPATPTAEIEALLGKAIGNLAPAKFYFGEKPLKDVRILGEAYYELVTLVKIMTWVLPILFILLLLYVTLLLWIF